MPFVHPEFDPECLVNELETHITRIKNAYWYVHRILKSKAKVYYGDIYNIPDQLGQFDVVMFGMVLLHLRVPFLELQSASRLSRECVIITPQAINTSEPIMFFMPDRKTRSDPNHVDFRGKTLLSCQKLQRRMYYLHGTTDCAV